MLTTPMTTLRSVEPFRAATRLPMPLKRHPLTTAALRERELQWWAEYGDAEERYFWVMPDAWQPPSRLRYLDRIAQALAESPHVVDYGCGSGWLSRELGERLRRPVTGLDFSSAQIAAAGRRHADCPWTLFMTINGPQDLPAAPAYVFHGLMHHLSTQEIHDLLGRLAGQHGARAIFVEPVCFPEHKGDTRDRVLMAEMEALVLEPWRVANARGVEPPPQVQRAREQGESRWWGEIPFGPSPMERPFEADELQRLLDGWFDASPMQLVQYLPASQALAGELAMLIDADRELADALAPALMTQMDALERAWLRMPRPVDGGWYMAMTEVFVR